MHKMVKLFKFKKKKEEEQISKNHKLLLEKYNRGEILQVDGKTDNVEYLKSRRKEHESEKVTE